MPLPYRTWTLLNDPQVKSNDVTSPAPAHVLDLYCLKLGFTRCTSKYE